MFCLPLSTFRGHFKAKNVQFLDLSSFACNSALQLNLGCAECPQHAEYRIFASFFLPLKLFLLSSWVSISFSDLL